MSSVSLRVRRAYRDPEGIAHRPGELLDLTPLEAVPVLTRGDAVFARPDRVAEIIEATARSMPRGTYRRRDLEAEQPAEPVKKPKRKYKRRDLVPVTE